MSLTQVVGIDPGLIHTGVVCLLFDKGSRSITVEETAVAGLDTAEMRSAIPATGVEPLTFIEGYRARSHFNSDARMIAAVSKIRKEVGGRVLNNTGVVKVIRQPLMELLGCWNFNTVTHHQDLRSAARIALFGMVKDPKLNRLLFQVVCDHLEGRTWHVSH